MKKLCTLLFIAIALMGQQVSAQIQKGEKMLGASLGANRVGSEQDNVGGNDSKTHVTNFAINPQLGFGLGNNWIIGINASYAFSKQKYEQVSVGTSMQRFNAIGAGIFLRKFHQMGSHFGLFAQGEAGYEHAKSIEKIVNGPDNKYRSNSVNVAVRPGAFYRPNHRFILEAIVGGIGYNHSSSKPVPGGTKVTQDNIYLNFTNNLSLGFRIVL